MHRPLAIRLRWLAGSLLLALALTAPSTAGAAGLRAPKLASPADATVVTSVPAFTWAKVKKADRYEFQLSADRNFGSIVLGRGNGSFSTKNLAATITKSLPDGEYWWRVRAVSAKGNAGEWSERWSIDKRWGPAPVMEGPPNDASVVFPTSPLVLKWTAVPRAYKYRVFIATDPNLGSLVLGKDPIETSATAFAPGVNLGPGRYYWAVEPEDVAGHRGARSAVGSFVWSWPSSTGTDYLDLVGDERLSDPQVKWNPVPGAVSYEVEINTADNWAPTSKVCCSDLITGTSLSPQTILGSNIYHWRVRAVDPDGNRGLWNVGTPFDKYFYDPDTNTSGTPTIHGLRIADNTAEGPAADADMSTPVLDVTAPVVRWDPLPGATSYEIKVWPYKSSEARCDLTSAGYSATVAGTAWTPLAKRGSSVLPPIPVPNGLAISEAGPELVAGNSYCVDVYALSGNPAVRSDLTRLGGPGSPAFRFAPPVVTPVGGPLAMTPAAYLSPGQDSQNPRLPVYRWDPIPGANAYWVYVARDAGFSNLVDVALTRIPSYAPRARFDPRTYRDEDTPYFWAVLPAEFSDGAGVDYRPPEDGANAPYRSFSKKSVPPQLLSPGPDQDVSDQPVFRWTSGDPSISVPEGAKSYYLQVATDEGFGNPVDEVTTQATSYTAEKAYPADSVLYWRVRGTDVNGVGLAYSETGTFRRRLPSPTILDSNPQGGSTIPPFLWTPVQGASSYDIHVDQSDGTRKDFNIRGTAFTPTIWYGTGIWRWQVRARFPSGSSSVASAYSGSWPFSRRIPSPDGVRTINSGGRVLMSWEPNFGVKEYRVEFSDTDSFARVGQTIRTQNLSVAPDVTKAPFVNGGTIFWRITAIDEGNNAGGSNVNRFVTARRMALKVSASLRPRRTSPVAVLVTDSRGRKVRKVKVRLSGRPVRPVSKRTSKKGTAKFKVRPRRRGTVVVRATRDGFRPAEFQLPVR
jgi:hypothetical protein